MTLLESGLALEVIYHSLDRLAGDCSWYGELVSREGWWRDIVAEFGSPADLAMATCVNLASCLSCSWWVFELVLVRAAEKKGKVWKATVGDQ